MQVYYELDPVTAAQFKMVIDKLKDLEQEIEELRKQMFKQNEVLE